MDVTEEELMNTKQFAVVVSFACALILVFAARLQMRAQATKTVYPSMAPLDQYLIDREG